LSGTKGIQLGSTKSITSNQYNNMGSKMLLSQAHNIAGHSKKLSKAELSSGKFLAGVKGGHQHQHSHALQSNSAMLQSVKVN